jgi:hypothetical protein
VVKIATTFVAMKEVTKTEVGFWSGVESWGQGGGRDKRRWVSWKRGCGAKKIFGEMGIGVELDMQV